MKKKDLQLASLLAAFVAGRPPDAPLDRRREDLSRPPGMPRTTYSGGAFPPYRRGMDPQAAQPRDVPQSEWFGTVGPYLPDELNPRGNETPLPLQNLIRLVLMQGFGKSQPAKIFPANTQLGALQRRFGVRPGRQNRRIG